MCSVNGILLLRAVRQPVMRAVEGVFEGGLLLHQSRTELQMVSRGGKSRNGYLKAGPDRCGNKYARKIWFIRFGGACDPPMLDNRRKRGGPRADKRLEVVIQRGPEGKA